MLEYFINCNSVSENTAFRTLLKAYMAQGYACLEELQSIWDARDTSEEARDTIFEVSGYTLEIFIKE